jgi:hypothetical protein
MNAVAKLGAMIAAVVLGAVGCAGSDDTLTASDPALVAALTSAGDAWQAAGVPAPGVASGAEANVQAVEDATFNERCQTTKTSTLACTFAPTDGGKAHMWIRASLLDNPTELQAIVTHEMGHVIQAHLTGSTPTHLSAAQGCVDGAPHSPHAMCAWAGLEITPADVALVEGE